MAKASAMRPGSNGGPVANAKAQPKQRQFYGKEHPASKKTPSKKPGLSGDKGSSGKASPLAGKKK